jgi:hypothetical protein
MPGIVRNLVLQLHFLMLSLLPELFCLVCRHRPCRLVRLRELLGLIAQKQAAQKLVLIGPLRTGHTAVLCLIQSSLIPFGRPLIESNPERSIVGDTDVTRSGLF